MAAEAKKKKKCFECGVKQPLQDMRSLKITEEVRRSQPLLILRNFVGMLLGKKPTNTKKRSWLFGHYQPLETRTATRWFCFNCFIKQLTPKEYALFRNAYHDDAVLEEGQEGAAEMVARLDAVFEGQEEVGC
jgi:hypothetical protein